MSAPRWSGANMRCPTCNKYMPDRCICPKAADMQPAPATEQATIAQAFAVDYPKPTASHTSVLMRHADHWQAYEKGWIAATQAERVQSSESIDCRAEFEAWAKTHFGCSEFSFARAYEQGYYNAVHSNTFGGQKQAEWAPVSMLWDVWQAARRATASKAEAPVAWLESEPSTRNLPIFDVLNSNCHTTIWHTRRAPVTDNPVWTVYGPSLAATTKQGTP